MKEEREVIDATLYEFTQSYQRSSAATTAILSALDAAGFVIVEKGHTPFEQGDVLIPISAASRAKLPLPTGDYHADEYAMIEAMTDDMMPETPLGYEFVQWEIRPPDDLSARFTLTPTEGREEFAAEMRMDRNGDLGMEMDIRDAIAVERERCAMVIEEAQIFHCWGDAEINGLDVQKRLVAAIRERGKG